MLNIEKTIALFQKKLEENATKQTTATGYRVENLKAEAERIGENIAILKSDLARYTAKAPTASDFIKEVDEARGNLKAIHDATGFDFCAPFKVAKLYGAITPKKALEAVGASGNDFVFVLVLDATRYTWKKDKLLFAELPIYGSFEPTTEKYKFYCRHSEKGHTIDKTFTKGDFEETRKNALYSYIFAQNRGDLKKAGKKDEDANGSDRYILASEGYGVSDGRGNSWKYSKVTLQKTTDNGARFEYHVNRTNDKSDFIDKSGYLVEFKRADLARRADALRSERAKAAYTATDYTEQIKELESTIKALKAHLIEKLIKAETGEEIHETGKKICYFDGLSGVFEDFETLKERDENKAFSSRESFANYYNKISEKIAKIY